MSINAGDEYQINHRKVIELLTKINNWHLDNHNFRWYLTGYYLNSAGNSFVVILHVRFLIIIYNRIGYKIDNLSSIIAMKLSEESIYDNRVYNIIVNIVKKINQGNLIHDELNTDETNTFMGFVPTKHYLI